MILSFVTLQVSFWKRTVEFYGGASEEALYKGFTKLTTARTCCVVREKQLTFHGGIGLYEATVDASVRSEVVHDEGTQVGGDERCDEVGRRAERSRTEKK